MIQRIQSVFLLLIVLAMLGVVALPLWTKTDPASGEVATLTAFGLSSARGTRTAAGGAITASQHTPESTWYIGVLALAAAAVAGYEIFQYRNRLTQMKLGLLNSVLIASTLGALVYTVIYKAEFYFGGTPGKPAAVMGDKLPGFWLPMVALLCNVLANRFIKRDNDLVRSADRLR
ncbi:MAG: DUF4293 domain-containing protein [Hymenobacteraceae bacterium]|nr:DUF4293 domain-containing protein [Hymenobacteraceae bacterium]